MQDYMEEGSLLGILEDKYIYNVYMADFQMLQDSWTGQAHEIYYVKNSGICSIALIPSSQAYMFAF